MTAVRSTLPLFFGVFVCLLFIDTTTPGYADSDQDGRQVPVFDSLIGQNAKASSGKGLGDKTAGWFNVRDLGARGDGVSDDTDAFRDAVALAADYGGGTVFVPAGDYFIGDGPLDVDSGIVLEGVSSKSSKIFDQGLGSGLFRILPGAERFAFQSLLLSAQGGHVWTSVGNCSRGHILDVVAVSYGENNSIWHHVNGGSWGSSGSQGVMVFCKSTT